MPRSLIIAMSCVFIAFITAVTILTALDKDPSQLVTLITVSLVPTITGLFAVKESAKARGAAETAVHNTNGRMGELIQTIQAQGGQVPIGYEDVPGVVTPDAVP